MKGTGTAWGAITIVNALPTGVGCAAAVDLPVEVRVELSEPTGPATELFTSGESDTPLVRSVAQESLDRFTPGRALAVRLQVRSSIPISRGLKSSSAVSVAVTRAIASAAGKTVGRVEAARLSARVARQVGTSATGAFDDALAAATGGIVVTKNDPDEPLRYAAVDSSWRAVLWIPPAPHAPSIAWRDAFRSRAAPARAAADLARSGEFLAALRLNTELVEEVLGYDYAALRAELERRGALGCGVSGMGPTLAAIAPASHSDSVARGLPSERGEVRTVEFARASQRVARVGGA